MRIRELLYRVIGSGAILIGVVSSVGAQGWPDRPVKIIMPYAPGGAGDAIARPWAEKMKALKEAGIHVVDTPAGIGETLKRAMAR